jgi:opacity protein-like surface antigen
MIKTAILLSLFLLAPAALAQGMERRGEVFGSLGGGKAYEDEGLRGNGLTIGGGVGYRLTPRVGIEAQINGMSYERNFSSGVRFEGTVVLTTANLLYHFSTSRVQPYVFGGIGHSYDRRDSQFPGDSLPFKGTAQGFAINFGAGVKIFLNKKYSLRPEWAFGGGTNEGVGTGFEQSIALGRASVAFTYHF